MYPNLKAEMARQGMTAKKLVACLNDLGVKMAASTFSLKMAGKYAFDLDEADAIRTVLKTDLSITELFEKAA